MEINAIVAGLSASLASVFSKLALEDGTNSLRHFSNALTVNTLIMSISNYTNKLFPQSQPLLLVLQLFCLLLVLVCNIVMWVYFARSLQKHSNTAQAKATITTCNFIFSVSGRHGYSNVLCCRRVSLVGSCSVKYSR